MPTKFIEIIYENKGSHTFSGPSAEDKTADWRDWGDLPIMWQNTRHIYHPLLTSGDTDLMMSLINTVYNSLEVSKERTMVYYKHGGAFMPEGMMPFGVAARNLIPDKEGKGGAKHLLAHVIATIEVPYYMLRYYEYSQDKETLKKKILPVTEAFVDYFDYHFPGNDNNNKMIMYPSGAGEKYSDSTNPMVHIAGLYTVLDKLLKLPPDLTTQSQRDKWTKIYNRLPELPMYQANGITLLAVAEKLGKGMNRMETPELYGVAPFQNFMIGKPNLDIARQTFAVRNLKVDGTPVYMNVITGGWNHNAVQCTYLGLPEESGWLVRNNLSGVVQDKYWLDRPKSTYIHRFQAFWGP